MNIELPPYVLSILYGAAAAFVLLLVVAIGKSFQPVASHDAPGTDKGKWIGPTLMFVAVPIFAFILVVLLVAEPAS